MTEVPRRLHVAGQPPVSAAEREPGTEMSEAVLQAGTDTYRDVNETVRRLGDRLRPSGTADALIRQELIELVRRTVGRYGLVFTEHGGELTETVDRINEGDTDGDSN